ncbi:MAG: PLDc N-terminal domain-containing protein [Lautropia sp.]|nr:PLDc N-terminal domain-containing protein [Lautropia sp.]
MTVLEHGAFAFCGLLVYVLVTRIGQHRRQPSAAVAWVLVIAMFPYVGLPLFLLFGTRKFARPGVLLSAPVPQLRAKQPGAAGIGGDAQEGSGPPAWATSLLASFALPPPAANLAIEFHADGSSSWQALLALLRNARRSLDLCTFVLGRDEIGDAVLDELKQAARRGVRVRLLLDAFGSLRVPGRRLQELRRAGVDVRRFMPLLHNPLRGRTNLRNHRKLTIADAELLWSGGRNQAAEYFIDRMGAPAWEDLSFTVRGPVALQAQALFEHDWQVCSGRVPGLPLPLTAGAPAPPQDAIGAMAQLIPSGPDHADDTVYALLLSAAYHAQIRILAVSPYFVPDDALLSALCLACRRGVALTLLVPARSNHPLADLARARSLRQLQQAGGNVVLYPSMMHAKAVVVDEQIALCGTVNLDARSLFLNFELMFAFYGEDEIAWLSAWIEERSRRSHPHDATMPKWWQDLMEGIVRAVGYQL